MLRFVREQAALRRGNLREALRLLRACDTASLARDERRLHRVLLAETLLFRGDVEEAVKAASAASSESGSPELQARALVVRGIVTSDSGDVDGAEAVFRRALDVARECEQPVAVAWVETRMIGALAERSTPARLAALAPEVRQHVVRSGDAQISAYFNITQSRLRAKANAIEEAWQHLDVAAAAIAAEPNHLLDALHGFAASLLCSHACRYTDAVQHGRRALQEARNAGYGRLVPRIHANLGLALLHLGHVGEAETLLDEALESPAISAEARIAMLDSKAQICLLRRDATACRARLERIEAEAGHRSAGWTWTRLARQETPIRLLMLEGDFQGAHATAGEARAAAQLHDDRLHAALFGALQADACVRLDDLDSAQELLDASAAYDPSLPLAGAIELERVHANLARARGDLPAQELHAGRVRRLVEAVGTAQQRDQLLRDRWLPAPVPPPAAVEAHHDPRHDDRSGLAAIEAVGHIVACAGHPELLAAELAATLCHAIPTGAIRLVTYDDAGRQSAERMLQGTRPSQESPSQCWPVGSDRHGRHELQVWVTGTPARAALCAMTPVAEAALALVASRRQDAVTPGWNDTSASETLSGVFGAAMRGHVQDVIRAAQHRVPVLLTGETGTGKELVARELHRLTRAPLAAFVPFNCAAVPREMLESQLFGHRRGAFTGANADFKGVVSEAEGGSLFLDEIGELDLALQPKLLRFLETGELQRLGEPRPLSVNVRTIAATNANVEEMIRAGRFREDLFYRLNTIHLHLPPLRERREDIPALARHFLDRFGRECGRLPLRLASSTVELLTFYEWPGNIRELLNEMRRLTVYGEPDSLVTPDRLSRAIRQRAIEAARRQDEVVTVRADVPLDSAVSQLERALIARAFRVSGGRVTEAAGVLGLSRKGLFLKRKRHRLD